MREPVEVCASACEAYDYEAVRAVLAGYESYCGMYVYDLAAGEGVKGVVVGKEGDPPGDVG